MAITTILDGGARVYDDDVVKSHKNVNQALAAYKCQPYLLFYKRKKKASRVTIDISSSSDLDLDLALPFANSFSEIEFLDTTGPTSKDALETTNDILRMEVQEHKVEKMVDLADADAVEEGDKVHKNQLLKNRASPETQDLTEQEEPERVTAIFTRVTSKQHPPLVALTQ